MNNSIKYDFNEVKSEATGRWADILTSIGGLSYTQLQNRHQPCPLCGGEDRYRFDNKDRTGTYYCNNCGAGDGWALLMKSRGWDFPEAAKAVGDYLRVTPIAPPIPETVASGNKTEINGTIINPVPEDAKKIFTKNKKAKLLILSSGEEYEFNYNYVWDWRDEDGNLIGYMARYQKKDGKKVVHQILFCETETGERRWCVTTMPDNRPLMGVHKLKDSKSPNVVIVEGETTMQACQDLLPRTPVLTWIGGSNVPEKSDWTSLKDKRLIVIPDNDDEGIAAIVGYFDSHNNLHKGILQLTKGIVSEIDVIQPPKDKPEGWDIKDAKDEGWTSEQLIEFIKANKREDLEPFKKKPKKNSEEPKKAPAKKKTELAPIKKKNEMIHMDRYNHDIIFIGFYGNYLFAMSKTNRMIKTIRFGVVTKSLLQALGKQEFFEMQFPKAGKEGVDWDAAAVWFTRQCERRGIYNPDKVRGRGCWTDAGRVVIHLGDRLLVDTETVAIENLESKNIYEEGEAVTPPINEPLTEKEIQAIIRATQLVNWEIPAHADCLLGWICDARVSGSNEWRAHCHVTGQFGSGKSTVLRDICAFLLGDFRHIFLGLSTEPGIRSKIMNDSIPCLFDEAEGGDKRANQQRVEQVIDFIRQNSTETGGIIAKGSASHIPTSFSTRCNFMIFSIDTPIKNKADESRITVLNILSPEVTSEKVRKIIDARWVELQEIMHFLHSCPNLPERFFARQVNAIPTRALNYKIFKQLITKHFGSARLGDQLGTLISGRWTFEFDRVGTVEEIQAFIASRDFNSYSQYLEVSQEQQVLNTIMEAMLRVPTKNGPREHSLGRLIYIMLKDLSMEYESKDIDDLLRDYGIRVEQEKQMLYIANRNSNLARILERTSVSENWARLLERVPGSVKPDKPVWFGRGMHASRCIGFPLEMILNETWKPAINELPELDLTPEPESNSLEFEGISQEEVIIDDDSLLFIDEDYNVN